MNCFYTLVLCQGQVFPLFEPLNQGLKLSRQLRAGFSSALETDFIQGAFAELIVWKLHIAPSVQHDPVSKDQEEIAGISIIKWGVLNNPFPEELLLSKKWKLVYRGIFYVVLSGWNYLWRLTLVCGWQCTLIWCLNFRLDCRRLYWGFYDYGLCLYSWLDHWLRYFLLGLLLNHLLSHMLIRRSWVGWLCIFIISGFFLSLSLSTVCSLSNFPYCHYLNKVPIIQVNKWWSFPS